MNTSVLQLGSIGINVRNAADKIQIVKDELRSQFFDLIVICGDLTSEGAPENFPAAGSLLDQLRGNLVDGDTEHWRQRILVVPGRGELDRENSLAGFYDFHAHFFRDAIALNRPVVRVLKDASLIGGFFITSESAASEHRFATLSEQVAAEIRRRAHVPYFTHGPVLLATAESPLLDPHLRRERWRTSVRQSFQLVDLYLFGSGEAMFLPSEPFCFASVSVGLGPLARQQGGISLNVLHFERPAALRPVLDDTAIHQRVNLGVCCHRVKANGRRTWSFDYYAKPSQSPGYSDEGYLSRRFIEKLEKQLLTKTLITVVGYGQVWRKVIANGLGKKTELANRPVTIVGLNLTEYPVRSRSNDQGWSARPLTAKDLGRYGWYKEFQKLRQAAESGTGQTIAVISDDAFARSDYEILSSLRKHLVDLCSDKFRILYLVSAYESPRVLENIDRRIGEIKLDPIEGDALDTLLLQNSLTVPIDSRLLTHISGGYSGFLSLFFDAVREQFQLWNKGKPITAQARIELAEQAIRHSPELRREASEFFDFVRVHEKGTQVARFLFEKLRAGGSRSRFMEPLEFSVSEAAGAGLDPDSVLDPWEQAQILSRDGSLYRLRERIPFLVELLQKPMRPKIFISYSEPDIQAAHELAEALKRSGFEPTEYTKINNFKARLESEISRLVRESAAVVVIWTENSIRSRYVLKEAKQAANPAGPKLINWYRSVQPPSVRDTIANTMTEREKLEKGRLLDAFKEYLGKFTLQDVVDTIESQLKPYTLTDAPIEPAELELCADMYSEV